VLVLSHQFAIEQNKTEGNTTYLANLQTRQTLGEIHGTDHYKSENQCFLHVVWAPDSSACALDYERRSGFDSVFLLELKGESFRQIDIAKHIQEALKRQFGVYAHFRFAPNGTLNVRALGYTNPKQFPDQQTGYLRFQGLSTQGPANGMSPAHEKSRAKNLMRW
jgi:hypothetical protein